MGEVIHLRRPAHKPARFEAIEPTQAQIVAALVMVLVGSLPESTKKTFRRSFQATYDAAPTPEMAAALREAARAVCAPLMARS